MANNFFIPFIEDKRFIYTGEFLQNNGCVLVNNKDDCDYVILPIPTKPKHIVGFENKFLFVGKANSDAKKLLNDCQYYDYFTDENYIYKNAIATSEGAVALIKEVSNKTIFQSKILVCGFGRIGKSLTKILLSMGGIVTVCSRSPVSKTEAEFLGASHIKFYELSKMQNYDYIINTVPHLVFTKTEIDNINSDAIFFDLASFPGGIDQHYADTKGIKIINGNFLPKRYSEKSAGYYIGESIIKKLKEGIL